MRIVQTGLLALVLILGGVSCATPLEPFRTGVVRDVVLLKFVDTLPPAQVDAAVKRFLDLPDEIAEIQSIEGGRNISPEQLSEGYTHVFVLTFRNQTNRNAYLKHPARAKFIRSMEKELERCLIMDYYPFDRNHQAASSPASAVIAPTVPVAPVVPAAPEPARQPRSRG
jgi:hypothetical protein